MRVLQPDTWPVDHVVVGRRLRPADPVRVRELADSIRERGLLHPIVLTPDGDLVAGLHRLEAVKLLGWNMVPVNLRADNGAGLEHCDDPELADRRIAEADENLARADLTALERAELLAERKRLYEEAHPETRAGVAGGKARQGAGATVAPAADVGAEVTASSRRTVQRAARIGGMPLDVRDQVRGTRLEDDQRQLEQLARVEDPAEQLEVARRVVAGEARTVAAAVSQVRTQRAERSAPPTHELVDLRNVTADELLETVEPLSVDLVIADPPWDGYDEQPGQMAPDRQYATLDEATIRRHLELAGERTRHGGRLALWFTWPLLVEVLGSPGSEPGEPRIRDIVPPRWRPVTGGSWHKVGGAPGGGSHWRGHSEPVLVWTAGRAASYTDTSTVLRNAAESERAGHSAKPVEWQAEWIRTWVRPGGTVLDLYAGWGSAALSTLLAGGGRRYVGCEPDPARHAEAVRQVEGR